MINVQPSNPSQWVECSRNSQLLDLLQPIAFWTLVVKGNHVKGERENTKPFPLSPAPYPQRGPPSPFPDFS